MNVAVVLVAAGSGERLGAGLPKALVSFNNRTILDWSLRAFHDHPEIDSVVVVAPAAASGSIAASMAPDVVVVAGGASRQQSVRIGLAALGELVDFVLVHDAARSLVPSSVISAVVGALKAGADAVVPVLPVIDTVKRVDSSGMVTATVPRDELRRAQTPQGFRLAVLLAAQDAADPMVTDDAGMIEAAGGVVMTVPGDEAAFKITTSYDLHLAELLSR
jgi:2-C-methyl-D-erythritol 4-phosphate cytidylyltransferase